MDRCNIAQLDQLMLIFFNVQRNEEKTTDKNVFHILHIFTDLLLQSIWDVFLLQYWCR